MGGKSSNKKAKRAAAAAAEENRVAMDQMRTRMEAEQRALAEQVAGSRRLRRGGARQLLSSARMDAEGGVQTLGAGPEL